MQAITVQQGEYSITTDQNLFDFDRVHTFLSTQSYWAKNIPFEVVKKSAANSPSFGVFHQGWTLCDPRGFAVKFYTEDGN